MHLISEIPEVLLCLADRLHEQTEHDVGCI
jgi:hypothetical protein